MPTYHCSDTAVRLFFTQSNLRGKILPPHRSHTQTMPKANTGMSTLLQRSELPCTLHYLYSRHKFGCAHSLVFSAKHYDSFPPPLPHYRAASASTVLPAILMPCCDAVIPKLSWSVARLCGIWVISSLHTRHLHDSRNGVRLYAHLHARLELLPAWRNPTAGQSWMHCVSLQLAWVAA